MLQETYPNYSFLTDIKVIKHLSDMINFICGNTSVSYIKTLYVGQ